MLIRCTKALLDKVRISQSELKSPEGYEELPCALMGWQANLVNINRRKVVVLMNNATRYSVVIYRPRPKEPSMDNVSKEILAHLGVLCGPDAGSNDNLIPTFGNTHDHYDRIIT
jgi:hypothetical protein